MTNTRKRGRLRFSNADLAAALRLGLSTEQMEKLRAIVLAQLKEDSVQQERGEHFALKWQHAPPPAAPGLLPPPYFRCEACLLYCDQSLLTPVQTDPLHPDTTTIKLYCVDCATPRNTPKFITATGVVQPRAAGRGGRASPARARPKNSDAENDSLIINGLTVRLGIPTGDSTI